MGRIKVLSIDGGGIRGIIAAAILEALQAQIGRELHEVFDLISGTSTGGIIALGIGTPAKNGRPYRPAELLELYRSQGPTMFAKSIFTGAKQLFGPKYSSPPESSLPTHYENEQLRHGRFAWHLRTGGRCERR